jgi:hypothetical protein
VIHPAIVAEVPEATNVAKARNLLAANKIRQVKRASLIRDPLAKSVFYY